MAEADAQEGNLAPDALPDEVGLFGDPGVGVVVDAGRRPADDDAVVVGQRRDVGVLGVHVVVAVRQNARDFGGEVPVVRLHLVVEDE